MIFVKFMKGSAIFALLFLFIKYKSGNRSYMKKILIFVLILSCLCSTLLVKNETNPIFNFENVEKVCFVSASDFQEIDDVESISCGGKFFNYCTLGVAKQNLSKLNKNSDAVQFYLSDDDVDTLFKQMKFEIVSTSQIESLTIYCGYTPYCQTCVYLDGKKVNMQLAVCEGYIVVGFPMILTGY